MQSTDTKIRANNIPQLSGPSILYAFKINLDRQTLAAFV